jgi:uncharacterized protein YecT (DUF1311 family)
MTKGNPMRFVHLGAALLLAVAASSSWAQQAECSNAPTQIAMDECIGKNLKAADQKLNETYRALLAKVSKDGAEQLRRAQRAWVGWRDAQCEFDNMSTRGGSIHSSMVAMCVEHFTREQTKHLDEQLHCKEGDLACGGQ